MADATAIVERPPVAKRTVSVGVLKRQSSTKNLYKLGEKAANHHRMMKRFNLRKMSSGLGIPTAFGRAVIDKTTQGQQRRFSLHRTIRSITNAKARQHLFRALVSPIAPKSWASTVHGIIMLVINHFQWIYLPVYACYFPDGSETTSAIAISLETFYLFNVLLNFNTAYVKQGVLVTSRRKIARHYVRKWFAFDLLSAIPVQAIHCMMSGYIQSTRDAVRAVQITLMALRLARIAFLEQDVLLARVLKAANHFTEWVRYSRYSHLLGIAQLMWLVLLIAHYMACFWHVVSCESSSTNMLTQTVGEKYIADYYYAVSLIQGQGNFGGTWSENLYSSVAIIAGSVILSIVFGNVAMLVSDFNANTTNYHRKMEAVYETMAKMDLPLRLRERVNEYYKHVWLEYEALDGNVNKFQQELTHTLGIEVGLYKHMDLVVMVPFWKDCTPDFLTQIVLNLDVRVYMPDDYVVRRREIGNEMMMINRGYCKLSKPSPQNQMEEGDNMLSSIHNTMFSTHDLDLASEMDYHQLSEDEDDSGDDESSDDEEQGFFGTGMFGASADSRRLSGNAFGLPDDEMNNFTDVRRFQNAHSRRPSYPTGTGAKKSKKYREYLHPGQAFGEMSLLMNYKRTANIRAITFVEMCVLGRKQFQQIISRYPEDRRRVLTAMLESCIEKKVIPFPWENIIEAVSAKRRSSGKKDISRANVIATMTAKEAARILVEAIDINAPDETIKYGFQSFDEGFIEDSSLRQANAADVKISDTLQRRRSSIRSLRSLSARTAMPDITDNDLSEETSRSSGGAEFETSSTSTSPSTPLRAMQSDKTLKNLLLLVESMAGNIARLQQDVSDLKNRDITPCSRCRCGGSRHNSSNSQRLASPTVLLHPSGLSVDTRKEEFQDQTARKPSIVASTAVLNKRLSHRSSDSKTPRAILRKLRSKPQDDSLEQTIPSRESAVVRPTQTPTTEATAAPRPDELSPRSQADRYPANLSGRSKAARNPTLSDMLWKRSNTSGDLLKHTDEERQAARLRRQIRTRRSMPSESGAEGVAKDGGHDDPGNAVPDDTSYHDDTPPVASWLPRSQPSALNEEF